MPQDHNQLEVYKSAYNFALGVYKATLAFPKEEQFGVTNQLRRAASSIGANIAEGCGRRTGNDFARFMYIAMGSIKECEHFLAISRDLKYLEAQKCRGMLDNLLIIGKMLTKLIQKVKAANQ